MAFIPWFLIFPVFAADDTCELLVREALDSPANHRPYVVFTECQKNPPDFLASPNASARTCMEFARLFSTALYYNKGLSPTDFCATTLAYKDSEFTVDPLIQDHKECVKTVGTMFETFQVRNALRRVCQQTKSDVVLDCERYVQEVSQSVGDNVMDGARLCDRVLTGKDTNSFDPAHFLYSCVQYSERGDSVEKVLQKCQAVADVTFCNDYVNLISRGANRNEIEAFCQQGEVRLHNDGTVLSPALPAQQQPANTPMEPRPILPLDQFSNHAPFLVNNSPPNEVHVPVFGGLTTTVPPPPPPPPPPAIAPENMVPQQPGQIIAPIPQNIVSNPTPLNAAGGAHHMPEQQMQQGLQPVQQEQQVVVPPQPVIQPIFAPVQSILSDPTPMIAGGAGMAHVSIRENMYNMCEDTIDKVSAPGVKLSEASVEAQCEQHFMEALMPNEVQYLGEKLIKGCMYFAKKFIQARFENQFSRDTFCKDLTQTVQQHPTFPPSQSNPIVAPPQVAQETQPLDRESFGKGIPNTPAPIVTDPRMAANGQQLEKVPFGSQVSNSPHLQDVNQPIVTRPRIAQEAQPLEKQPFGTGQHVPVVPQPVALNSHIIQWLRPMSAAAMQQKINKQGQQQYIRRHPPTTSFVDTTVPISEQEANNDLMQSFIEESEQQAQRVTVEKVAKAEIAKPETSNASADDSLDTTIGDFLKKFK